MTASAMDKTILGVLLERQRISLVPPSHTYFLLGVLPNSAGTFLSSPESFRIFYSAGNDTRFPPGDLYVYSDSRGITWNSVIQFDKIMIISRVYKI